jgi:hypothetical protein
MQLDRTWDRMRHRPIRRRHVAFNRGAARPAGPPLDRRPPGRGPGQLPLPDAAVEASQARSREVRQYLIESGIGLAARTADLYDPALRVEHVPAISAKTWLPSQPIPLENLTLRWEDNPPGARITGDEAEARPTLPRVHQDRHPRGTPQRSATSARQLSSRTVTATAS